MPGGREERILRAIYVPALGGAYCRRTSIELRAATNKYGECGLDRLPVPREELRRAPLRRRVVVVESEHGL